MQRCFLSINEFCTTKNAQQSVHLTLGILAKISSIFLRLSIFPVGRLRRPRPSAGNANRWALRVKYLAARKLCRQGNCNLPVKNKNGGIKWH